MSNKPDALTAAELGTLNDLLRRFYAAHVHDTGWRSEVMATQGLVGKVMAEQAAAPADKPRCICMGPNPDGRHAPNCPADPKVPTPATAGPNPIPVSELLNQGSIYDSSGIAPWRS